MRMQIALTSLVVLLLAVPWLARWSAAEPPHTMSYQGRLFQADIPYTGVADFKFVIVVEGVTLWSNDESSTTGNEPIASVPIEVSNGVFFVLLGDPAIGMTPLSPHFFDTAPPPMLRIWVNTGSGFEQLEDVPLASSLYSLCAETANQSIGDFLVEGEVHTLGGIRFPDDTVQLTASTGGTDADWTISGNDMYAAPSGNVGIGTSNPQQKLHVVGVSEFTVPGGRFLFSTAGGWPGIIMYSPSGYRRDMSIDDGAIRLQVSPTSAPPGPSSGLFIRETGYVGIGTYNPDGELQVNGTATAARLRVRRLSEYVVESYVEGGTTGAIDLGGPGGTSSNLGLALRGDTGAGGGQATFYNSSGNYGVQVNGDVGGGHGSIDIYDGSGSASLRLYGAYGGGDSRVVTDVLEITGGADLSEQFDVAGQVAPGMTVCIDPARPGQLAVSRSAYDRKVAGIVSGAGGVKPGMLMGQSGSLADGGLPVALSGRVWTLCDTQGGVIEPGDLLTTSSTPGHAMKATDRDRAHGAILGKAMTSLESGRGLVLVLVNLQ